MTLHRCVLRCRASLRPDLDACANVFFRSPSESPDRKSPDRKGKKKRRKNRSPSADSSSELSESESESDRCGGELGAGEVFVSWSSWWLRRAALKSHRAFSDRSARVRDACPEFVSRSSCWEHHIPIAQVVVALGSCVRERCTARQSQL